MTFLNLSIVNVKNFFLQISFRKLKSKYEIILGWSFDVRDCFLCVHRFLEVAVGFCSFEYEKPAKNRFFKLFVISPVQWIAWTQNYFFFNKVTKRDVLARGKKIRFFHECHAIFDFLGKWLLMDGWICWSTTVLLSWFAMNSCKQKQNAILMLNHHFTTKVRSDTFIQWRFTKVQPQISSCLELKYQAALATRKKVP